MENIAAFQSFFGRVTGKSEKRGAIYAPKDQEALSDRIKRHLEREFGDQGLGIIVNREVMIRPSGETGEGEITDILVDAIAQDPLEQTYSRITVVIETKCCWYAELHERMERQLANRYLKDTSYHHGLYIVGWYFCPQWNDSDYRLLHNAYKIPMKGKSMREELNSLTPKAIERA